MIDQHVEERKQGSPWLGIAMVLFSMAMLVVQIVMQYQRAESWQAIAERRGKQTDEALAAFKRLEGAFKVLESANAQHMRNVRDCQSMLRDATVTLRDSRLELQRRNR